MNTDFGENRTPMEVIKEGAFEGTYFRDMHLGVNGKLDRNSGRKFNDLEDIDWKYYKHGVTCGT